MSDPKNQLTATRRRLFVKDEAEAVRVLAGDGPLPIGGLPVGEVAFWDAGNARWRQIQVGDRT